MPSLLLPLLIAAVAALAVPATAQASPSLEIGIADDRVMLQGTDAEIERAADRWAELGIDVVRLFARWGSHVPQPESRTMPAGFDAADPASEGYRWAFLDRAMTAVRSRGMKVVLTVTGSGPLWASSEPARGNPRHKPDPARFAQFATAVARRYGDQVDRYIVWNEPNLPLWLQPQSTCKSGRCTPYSPHLYRRLYAAAEPAIRTADPGAKILAGALAPRGENARSANAKLRPLAWLRALGCVTSSYRRTRSGLCAGFAPVRVDGIAYHPHGILASPSQRSPLADNAQLADLGRLTKALDRIQNANGIKMLGSGRLPLYFTEYGYQTNPPDRFTGVSSAKQSSYLQEAAYRSWQHPRVQMLVQYVWQDEPGRGAGWQSGLLRSDGRSKSALGTFPDPFWALRRDRRTVRLWGQVRPGSASSEVRLERTSASGRWVRVATVRTDARGFYKRDVPMSGRARWRARTVLGTTSARTVDRAR